MLLSLRIRNLRLRVSILEVNKLVDKKDDSVSQYGFTILKGAFFDLEKRVMVVEQKLDEVVNFINSNIAAQQEEAPKEESVPVKDERSWVKPIPPPPKTNFLDMFKR